MIEQNVVETPKMINNPKHKNTISAQAVLNGDVKGLKRLLPFLGPAFIASVAYLDPGNFATNITAGSKYGYLLLWVIAASNLMAVLIQSLSAKLGIATGKNLPEVARERFPKGASIFLWIQSELVIIATGYGGVYRGSPWTISAIRDTHAACRNHYRCRFIRYS